MEIIKLKGDEHLFHFKLLDKSLGRIQWLIEFYPAKENELEAKRIGKIWVWAKQTNDKRYKGKVFEIETWAEAFSTSSIDEGRFAPWRVSFCNEHKDAFIMDAYPKDGYSKLRIETFSSISISVNFEK